MLDFTDLFIQTPGDFFYHIVIVLTLSTGLMIAYGQRTRHPQSRTAGIYGAALAGAVGGWLFIVIGALVSIYTNQDARGILPPLERAVTVGMILLINWAYLTADKPHEGNVAQLLLLTAIAMTALGYVFTGVQWAPIASTTDFNLSQFGLIWSFAQALITFLSLILTILLFRRTIDAPLKILFWVILLAGFSGTLWQMATGRIIGDYSGFSRLGLFIAVPIIPFILYRKVIYGYELAIGIQKENTIPPPTTPPTTSAEPAEKISRPPRSPVERESVQLLRTLGIILEETSPADIPARIVRAAVEVLKADVGALLDVNDANYADILTAYDHAMRRPIPAMLALNLEQQMTLVNAIERKKQRPLFADRNQEELRDLYSRLDVPQIGPAYFQPLMRDDELIAILVIALPYAKRELRDAERELLKGIGIISGSLLALSYAANDAMNKAEKRVIHAMVSGTPLDEVTDNDILVAQEEMQSALEAAKFQNDALQRQVAELKIKLDDERTRLTTALGDTEEGLSLTQRITALNEEQEQLRQERDQLAVRLQEAETALTSATGTDENALFNTQIETLNREKKELTAELNALHKQLKELRNAREHSDQASYLLDELNEESQRLQVGKQQLSSRLLDVEDQLKALGIDGSKDGLTQVVQQLYDQRNILQAKTEALQVERDALLNERRRFEKRIRQEDERETQLETMEAEIRHLATDREAITRQRDAIRQEKNQLEDKIDRMKEQRARLLADVSVYQDDIAQLQTQLDPLQSRLDEFTTDYEQLRNNHETLRAEFHTVQNERDQLMARIEGNRERLQQLSNEANQGLREMIQEITAQRDRIQQELNDAQAALEQQKSWAASLATPTPTDPLQQSNGANPQLLMSMVDSLKTPMTSIVGYIDLLVSESAGLLSEMQRKFIQRISANIIRLETMLNDLTHLTALDTGTYKLNPQPSNIVNLLEDGITNATHQFREKDLIVQIQLNDNLPIIPVDRTGIEQVISQLLTNAYLVSPAESEVEIRTELGTKDTGEGQVRIAIRDSGGGIPDDEQSEVFARRYRTEHQLVSGLGDTGVGLSIAKALVEAHGGEMWFDSVLGEGTTFYVALPTVQPAIEEQ